MERLLSTSSDKLYTIATIIILLMIVFPPVYTSSSFRGYEFIFDLRSNRLIDLGRLSLQFIALGTVVFTIKRLIQKS